MRPVFPLVAAAVLWIATVGSAADWPRFRGPDGDGKTTESVPTEWSATKNVAWKVDLKGSGSSSPIVVGDRVYVTSYTGSPDELVRHLACFEKTTGKAVWVKDVPAEAAEDPDRGFIGEHGYATSTPVSDGNHVFCFFGKSGVYAFGLDGEILWRTPVGTESSNRRWGSAASLVLHGDTVIVNASEESQSIRALEKSTGKEVWKAEASSLELVYNTPLLVTPKEGKPELVVSVPQEVWSFDPDTGKLKWYAETDIGGNVSPSVVTDGEVVYTLGGRPAASAAVRLGGEGDVTDSHVVWNGRLSSYVPSPVLHEGRLYWVDDSGTAHCVNAADGEVVYRERLDGGGGGRSRGGRGFYASILLAGDRILATSRKNGCYVYKVGPEFELLGRNDLGDDSDFNASPAVSDGRLYLRSNETLYCIGTSSAK